MTILSLTALSLCIAGQVTVHLAPDQPLPLVSMDDPLVMEFVANADGAYTVDVTVTAEGHIPENLTLGTLNLQADRPYWTIVKGLTLRRGPHRVDTVVTSSKGNWESSGTVHRIDRALGNTDSQIGISFKDGDLIHQRAVMEIPHNRLQWSGSLDNIEEFMLIFSGTEPDLHIDVHANTTSLAATEAAKSWGKSISEWHIPYGSNSVTFSSTSQAIWQGHPLAHINAYFTDPNGLGMMIRTEKTPALRGITIPYDTARRSNFSTFNAMAERTGVEKLPITLNVVEPADSHSLVKTLFLSLTQPVKGISIPIAAIQSQDHDLPQAFSYITRLAHISSQVRFVGTLAIDSDITGYVFRRKNPEHPKNWSILAWTNAAPGHYEISVGNAPMMELQDILNNTLDTLTPIGETVSIPLDARPVWVQGDRGGILAQVMKDAVDLSSTEAYMAILPKAVQDMVSNLQECDPASSKRLALFTLLRAFPELESSMQSRTVPSSVGVPVCAALARMVNALAVLEQETGTPFLEPTSKIRASVLEFQSAYRTRTATAGGTHERPGWLLAEVSRLLELSLEIEAEGRPIEASAIASLAEWRARSLDAYTQ